MRKLQETIDHLKQQIESQEKLKEQLLSCINETNSTTHQITNQIETSSIQNENTQHTSVLAKV
jgi:hypothetical protein